jgi:ankyrin repeat protein
MAAPVLVLSTVPAHLAAVHCPSIEERMNRIDEELIGAVVEKNVPEVRRLLRAGADIEAKNVFGATPLIMASLKGHLQVVKELREHGADIEATEDRGWTPLHFACELQREVQSLAVVSELLSPGAEMDANNDSNGATTSILGKRKSRGANIEAKDRYGNTPLHFASIHNNLAIVKALLSSGADILAANNQGRLPIHRAFSRGHSAVIKCLLKKFYATRRQLPIHNLLEDLTWIANSNGSGAPLLRVALRHYVLGTDDVFEILEYLVS